MRRRGDLVELPTGAKGRLVSKSTKYGPMWLVDILTGTLKGRQSRHEENTLKAWKGE